jgi:hypothetical protein
VRARARASASETSLGQLRDGYILAGQILLAVLLSHAMAQVLIAPAHRLTGGLVFVLALWPILGISFAGARRTAGTAATTARVVMSLLPPHRELMFNTVQIYGLIAYWGTMGRRSLARPARPH